MKFNNYIPIGRDKFGSRKLNASRCTKRKVLIRDNFKCTICGNKAEMTHHKIPIWQDRTKVNDADNLESICKKCHNDLHYNNRLKFLKEKGVVKKVAFHVEKKVA